MAQPKFDCFAVTPPGTERLCALEISALGLAAKTVVGGVEFNAIARDLYRVNLWSRIASRVLVRLGTFRCRDFPELHRQGLKLPWGRFIRPGSLCQVRASCKTSRLIHSGRVEQTLSIAIGKALGTEGLLQELPAQLVFVRIENDQCTVSVDSTGDLLHRRGYRKSMVAAPLRENLAAAILLKLGYDGSRPLVDAMTGSGSFAIEAALIAKGFAPGRSRHFAFMDWPHYKSHVWTLCLQDPGMSIASPAPIVAVDQDPLAVAAARENVSAAGVADLVSCEPGRMEDLKAQSDSGLLVCNPPYGERLGEVESLRSLYRDFGALCRGTFRNWSVGWISADRRFARDVNMNCRRLWSFSNGGIEVELRQRVGSSEKS